MPPGRVETTIRDKRNGKIVAWGWQPFVLESAFPEEEE
jgi:hypothetical protein